MRSISSTLLAAQRLAEQSPRVRVHVRDKQVRVAQVGNGGMSNAQSALCYATGGGSVERLVAAYLDTSGNVYVKSVADPTSWASWGAVGSYTLVVSGAMAWPARDVALSCTSGVTRLFYVLDGGSAIQCLESADAGVTWSGPVNVKTGLSGSSFRLASGGNNDCFWWRNVAGHRYVSYERYTGGAWGSIGVLNVSDAPGGGELIHCYGIAACWWSQGNKFGLVTSFAHASGFDAHMVSCWVTAAGILSSRQRFVPPGYAATGAYAYFPSLIITSTTLGQRWMLSYIDVHSSEAGAWSSAVLIRSHDFAHWSYRVPQTYEIAYSQRAALAMYGAVGYSWACNQVFSLSLWYSGNGLMEVTIPQKRVVRYRMDEDPLHGRLILDLDNRDGTFDHAGEAGDAYAMIRPMSWVYLDQGLKTSAGSEYVTHRPFYIWTVARLQGPNENSLRLECVDGWELFRRWRPDCTYVFEGQTLKWMVQEVCARVGFWQVYFDTSTEVDLTVERVQMVGESSDWLGKVSARSVGRWVSPVSDIVMWKESQDGYAILMQLLAIMGAWCRFGASADADGIYCFLPWNYGKTAGPVYVGYDHEYNAGEIHRAQIGSSVGWPTRVRAAGEYKAGAQTLAVVYQLEDNELGQASGMEFFQLLYAPHWGSVDSLAVVAKAGIADGVARKYAGWIETRPQAAVEVFDQVRINDALAGHEGYTDQDRRVTRIVTEYDPPQSRWLQRVEFENV